MSPPGRGRAAFAAAVFAACCAPVCAADDPVESLLACRSIAEAPARLACFDREIAAFAEHRAPVAAARSQTVPGVAAAPDPEQQFGLTERAVAAQEVAAGARAADTPRIEAHVVQLSQNAGGRVVVELDNRQVWRQVVGDGELLLRKGDAVYIARAALGSYWLSTTNGRGCRVTRVR